MKCANCAKDNPAGARYCIHCGAEQALPTPIAAVAAAAMASGGRNPLRQAANAAQAEPLADHALATESEPARWQSRATSDPGEADVRAPSHSVANAVNPAYAALPRRTGLAVALVAACIVVAAIAFAVLRFVQPDTAIDSSAARESGDSVMSSFPPDATPPATRRSPSEVGASGTTTAANDATTTSRTSPPANAAPPATSTAEATPVEIRPLPARPAPRSARRATPDKAVEQPSVAQPPPPTPAPAVVAALPKPAAARATDPWARVREELSRCTREDFIARVICDQRVRFRYCKDSWGKVPECPGNPTADHGQ